MIIFLFIFIFLLSIFFTSNPERMLGLFLSLEQGWVLLVTFTGEINRKCSYFKVTIFSRIPAYVQILNPNSYT